MSDLEVDGVEDKLKDYREKRHFESTPEPTGSAKSRELEHPVFVIQKHSASRLHYDFRLEVDNVLKSWAVPKGPSTDPKEKHLAIPTEDHPMDYAHFEGTISEGQYGAGEVIVWDTGTFENLTKTAGQAIPIDQAIESGHVSFRLNGEKLRGKYALTRFQTSDEDSWLLVKKDDEFADPDHDITVDEPESVISGRTIEDIKAGRKAR